jgi:hypothetical protein
MKKGTKQKTTIFKDEKTDFQCTYFLMQMNYLIRQDDSDNIILMVEIINLVQNEMFLKICFFLGFSCKTDNLRVAPFYKIGRLQKRTASLPPPSKSSWRDTKNDSLTPLNVIPE